MLPGWSTPQRVCGGCQHNLEADDIEEQDSSDCCKRELDRSEASSQAHEVNLAQMRQSQRASTLIKLGYQLRMAAIATQLQTWRSRSAEAHVKLSVRVNIYRQDHMLLRALGAFHSGVEISVTSHTGDVQTEELLFNSEGIVGHTPKCPEEVLGSLGCFWQYYCQHDLGTRRILASELEAFGEDMCCKWGTSKYDLIRRNCNHFSNWVARELTGRALPGWLNRPARICAALNMDSILGNDEAVPTTTACA